MGIEKLTGTLLKEAESEAEKIIQAAEGHVKKMKEDERAKVAVLKADAETEVAKILNEQRNERLAWARLEGKRIISEAKEDAINNAIEDIFSLLKEIKKSKEYSAFLSRNISAALKEFGDAKLIIHIEKSDKGLLPKLPQNCSVETDLDKLGGAVIETVDGKMKIDLTLETLVDLKKDDLRRLVAKELFEERERKEQEKEQEGKEEKGAKKTRKGES